jgi:large-conductance mechanosensitive channel
LFRVKNKAPLFLLLFLAIFFLASCQESNNKTRPYLYGTTNEHKTVRYNDAITEKRELAQIDAKTKEEIARIDMQKAIEVQKLKSSAEVQKATLEQNSSIEKAKINKEVALSEQALTKELHASDSSMQKWWLLAVIVGLIIVLFFIYLMVRKRHTLQMQLQNEKLEHEKQLKEQEMRMHMANKILDTLSSGKISQEQQNRLLNALEQKSDPQLPQK